MLSVVCFRTVEVERTERFPTQSGTYDQNNRQKCLIQLLFDTKQTSDEIVQQITSGIDQIYLTQIRYRSLLILEQILMICNIGKHRQNRKYWFETQKSSNHSLESAVHPLNTQVRLSPDHPDSNTQTLFLPDAHAGWPKLDGKSI